MKTSSLLIKFCNIHPNRDFGVRIVVWHTSVVCFCAFLCDLCQSSVQSGKSCITRVIRKPQSSFKVRRNSPVPPFKTRHCSDPYPRLDHSVPQVTLVTPAPEPLRVREPARTELAHTDAQRGLPFSWRFEARGEPKTGPSVPE